MNTDSDPILATQALRLAVIAAGRAPSIHNTQPWRWQVADGAADLYAQRTRQLRESDPDGRMLTISCGTALHHAELALAAEGYRIVIDALPDPTDPDHLARITTSGRTAVDPVAMRHYQTTEIRHTDRRPLLDVALPADAVDGLRSAAARFGIGFDLLARDQVVDLAAALSRAQRDQVADPAGHSELDAWVGRHRPDGAGIPDSNVPDHASRSTVPMRDFGHRGSLSMGDTHDVAARYAILYGANDQPSTWLRAGQALSAVWLTATEHGLAVLPLSVAAESPATRGLLRRILSGVGYPCLALRLGVPDPEQPAPPRTPRLPVTQVVVEAENRWSHV